MGTRPSNKPERLFASTTTPATPSQAPTNTHTELAMPSHALPPSHSNLNPIPFYVSGEVKAYGLFISQQRCCQILIFIKLNYFRELMLSVKLPGLPLWLLCFYYSIALS